MSIPTNLARIPNLLSSQIMLSSINRVNADLLRTNIQLASGKMINRPSDSPIGASAVAVLDDILERREQRIRNLSHADAVLNNVDAALGDAGGILQEAHAIGLGQIGIGSDAATRSNQAKVIDAMLQEMFNIANRSYQDIHLFGGSRTAAAPFDWLIDGIVYTGNKDDFQTDLGLRDGISLTLPGDDAFGALSARVHGDRNLDPAMVNNTRLIDLNGAQGFGVRLGTVNLDVNGTDYELDLSNAETVGDVATLIEDFLNLNEPGVLDANGVRIDPATGNRFEIDLTAGNTVSFGDQTGSFAAADLGLSQAAFQDGVNETGADVDPRLTELTTIAQLSGVTTPLGTLRIENAGQVRDVDLSGVTNVRELMNAVDALGIGVRVEINDAGDHLNFVNELSGALMSIGEVAGGTTATELGVRSLTTTTELADFNQGRGVEILSGYIDPVTGVPDPSRDLDFRVTVKDGRTFDVDLVGATTVQDVLDALNAAAGAAGLTVPAEFEAGLAADGNGIALTDNTVGTTTGVERLNGSFAASDLGILGSTTGATLTGEDRATVAVDSAFAHLIALRDALEADDERGIEFASAAIEGDIDRLTRARAEIGVRSQRITRLETREQDLKIQDTSLKSEIQDLDFAEAAVRLSTLQTQLQASLATTSQALSLSLIDFLR